MALYHKDVFLPPVALPQGRFKLTYGRHARRAANNDRYGYIPLPAYINTRSCEVIEIELTDNTLTKIVYRQAIDATCDMCIVIIPRVYEWFVKTVWLNHSDDKHVTLNRCNYDTSMAS